MLSLFVNCCGLLKGSYLPDSEQESLGTLVRHRKTLILDRNRFILRMQKAMEMMNTKLHTVIRDIAEKTGIAIVKAIIRGERNPYEFLRYINKNIKADHETIAKSLKGNGRSEQLYLLKDCYHGYFYYCDRIAACDQAIERQLHAYLKSTAKCLKRLITSPG